MQASPITDFNIYFEITKLFIQLGIAGAILYVLWRLQASSMGMMERIMNNHLEHIHLELKAIRNTLISLITEVKISASEINSEDSPDIQP